MSFTLPIDNTGTRVFDRDVEDHANWLGPAILIFDEAALHIQRSALSTETACAQYGVSAAVLRMRIKSRCNGGEYRRCAGENYNGRKAVPTAVINSPGWAFYSERLGNGAHVLRTYFACGSCDVLPDTAG